jgi:hypothetical protein
MGKYSMAGLTVRRLIPKGHSNKMSFTHINPCGFQSRIWCVFCHILEGQLAEGEGVGGLSAYQCVSAPNQ